MKRLLTFLVFITLSMLLITCDQAGNENDIVQFKMDGVTVTLRLGFLETESIPMIERVGDTSILFAADEVTDYDEPNAYTLISWIESGTGTFSADFDYYNYDDAISLAGTVTLVVDEWSDVGGYCTGTFSGTVQDGGTIDVAITNGIFNVKRVADDTFGF